MIILNGNTLGERQKDLNMKVNEAALNNVEFEQIKNETEHTDVDKLFKIDLASKHKNIDYIVEVLKSGDTLYISRALKSTWMYNDEFSHIINTDYLHHNIFPFMSSKMKKKLLTTISNHVRDIDRSIAFCKYCMKTKLTNIALKFLVHTRKFYKPVFLPRNPEMLFELIKSKCLQHFVGNSPYLAFVCLTTVEDVSSKLKVLHETSYLYWQNDEHYLDMLEKNIPSCEKGCKRLGLRISKDIMIKHRDRVLKNPLLYINLLNKTFIVKYSTPENVRIYLPLLLPDDVNDFWSEGNDFCSTYEYILNILPLEDRFDIIKKIFCEKYPQESFEKDVRFYQLEYYRFMIEEQKENWALDQIADQKEIFGPGNGYKWYRFVDFEKAFDEVIKLVKITTRKDKRNYMICTLIKSAKTYRDLEKLFKYYYDRHNNEMVRHKEHFVNSVARHVDIYAFDPDCWAAFNKIYQNLDVYSIDCFRYTGEYKIIAYVYHVINNIDVHETLKLFMSTHIDFFRLKMNMLSLSKEKQDMVYDYTYKFYLDKIREFESVLCNNDVKLKVRRFVRLFYSLLDYYKPNEDIPAIITKFLELDKDEFVEILMVPEPQPQQITQTVLIRCLKTDGKLVVDNLPLVKKAFENKYTRLNIGKFLKKIHVFFPNDVALELLKFYNELMTSCDLRRRVARAACYGIFHLGGDDFKIDFVKNHAPTQDKFNHCEIDERLLNIQVAICATAFYARPPLPLENMLMYVKGDYVQRCLPMFGSYFAHLPQPLCMEFIKTILNKPVSIQKHGIRFAFTSYDEASLKDLILDIWQNTKNVSVRLVIYKALFNKIVKEDPNTHSELFKTLRTLTLDLHEDDANEIFELLTSDRLPDHLISDYIDTAWKSVSSLDSQKLVNVKRKADLISFMNTNIKSICQDIISSVVETSFKDEFSNEEIIETILEPNVLNQNLWQLTANYITYVQNKDNLNNKLELTKIILTECCNRSDLDGKDRYILQRFIINFIRQLVSISLEHNLECFEYLNMYFESLLQMIHDSSPIEEMYLILWTICINKAIRKALFEIENEASAEDEDNQSVAIKAILHNFGKDVGNLIKGIKEKNMYLKSFEAKITSELITGINAVGGNLAEYYERIEDVLVITSLALLDFKIKEIYLFALNILPSRYNGEFVEDYKTIINELKQLNDLEIKSVMFDKFLNCDFEPWREEEKAQPEYYCNSD